MYISLSSWFSPFHSPWATSIIQALLRLAFLFIAALISFLGRGSQKFFAHIGRAHKMKNRAKAFVRLLCSFLHRLIKAYAFASQRRQYGSATMFSKAENAMILFFISFLPSVFWLSGFPFLTPAPAKFPAPQLWPTASCPQNSALLLFAFPPL